MRHALFFGGLIAGSLRAPAAIFAMRRSLLPARWPAKRNVTMRTLLAFLSLIWWSVPAASQTLPWKSVVPQPRAGAARIYLMYDMEGLSGVSNGRMVVAHDPEFAHGRERLVADWQTEHTANRAYEHYHAHGRRSDGRRHGKAPKPYTPPSQPEGKINLSDPDSKNMKAYRGYVQGYNAQAVATERQIIVAAEIAPDGLDFAQLDPMIKAAERELAAAGVRERPGVVLADAGYWSNEHIDSLRERGMIPIVAPDADRSKGPRKTRLGGPYDFMRAALQTATGKDLYSRRQVIIEPVFADIKQNRRAGRFKRRGRAAVRSEWRLIAATHNLLKLHRSRLALAGA